MPSAISIGAVLQNRYRVVQLLGQGGFGRTYLVEDQGRFNEPCALKEFVPVQGEDRFTDKASQLFQREAAILYQISHPQIPQFRATFEENQRLFLVQDYVEGVTYRQLLDRRQYQGKAFSETEVRQFLQQLLPVLAHIHAKGIIHRDISPDNIILRRADQLPVLIDFGVVKEVVTRIQFASTAAAATTVGKAGYAPSEQMQAGRAYPSSDLFSLAVTAVVLLTGKEPAALFDDTSYTWQWQNYASASPAFAQVLNKALNYRPGDRYQNVREMVQALSDSRGNIAVPPSAGTTAAHSTSELRTVAVGRPQPPATAAAQPATARSTPARPTRVAPPPEHVSLLENPWAVTAMGVGLALVAGIGGWAVVSALNSDVAPNSTVTPMPTVTPTPTVGTPTPDPVPTEPVDYDQPLTLTPGSAQTVEGSVGQGDTVNYRFPAEAGQTLSVALDGEGVLLTVLGPNGRAVNNRAKRVASWNGRLSEAGEYTVQLSPVRGLESSNYSLNLNLTNPPTTGENNPDQGSPDDANPPDVNQPKPEPKPEANPEPSISQQRVQFPGGESSARYANSVSSEQIRRYVVNAQQGQIMTVQISNSQGPAKFDVRLPGGRMMADAEDVLFWQSYLPEGGDYFIDVKSEGEAEFTLDIAVTAQLEGQ